MFLLKSIIFNVQNIVWFQKIFNKRLIMYILNIVFVYNALDEKDIVHIFCWLVTDLNSEWCNLY